MRLAVLAIVTLALVLPGCATLGATDLRARAALEDLVAAFTTGAGSLSHMEGTLSGGGYSVPFELDVSRDGTRHFNLSAGAFTIDVYCRGDRVVRMIGGSAFLARGGCPLDGGRFGSQVGVLDGLELVSTSREGVLLVAVFEARETPDPDVQASEETSGFGTVGNVTLWVDGRGNARRVMMSAPGESGMNATASHEPRRRWSLPDADEKLAASVEGDSDFDAGTFEWRVDEAYDNVSLDEIEVRVARTSTGERVATFRPTGNEQNVSGLLFRFEDADLDGRLSEHDGFTLAGPAWQDERDFEVVVWDTWADAPLAGRRIPHPGLSFLALAIGLALALAPALALHSRQRG